MSNANAKRGVAANSGPCEHMVQGRAVGAATMPGDWAALAIRQAPGERPERVPRRPWPPGGPCRETMASARSPGGKEGAHRITGVVARTGEGEDDQ